MLAFLFSSFLSNIFRMWLVVWTCTQKAYSGPGQARTFAPSGSMIHGLHGMPQARRIAVGLHEMLGLQAP